MSGGADDAPLCLSDERAWGIEVGATALRALQAAVDTNSGRLVGLQCELVGYAEAAPGWSADDDAPVADALKVMLGRRELTGGRIGVSVPGRAGLIAPLAVPPVEPKQLDAVVAIEAKQRLPVALDDLAWDYQPLVDGPDAASVGPRELVVTAIRRDLIEQTVRPFRTAGVDLDLVQLEPNALANVLSLEGWGAGGRPFVLVDISHGGTTVVTAEGIKVWHRTVPIGGRHFTAALAEKAKLSPEKAELVKCNPARLRDPRSVLTAVRTVLEEFADQLERTLHGFRSSGFRGESPKILLAGNGAKLVGLTGFLRLRLGPDVETLGEFPRLLGAEIRSDPRFQDQLPSLGVAYGLAAQALGKGPVRSNLLPAELRRRSGRLLGRIGRMLGGR